jgi:hypothetical protein
MMLNSFSTLSPSDVSFNISPLHGVATAQDSVERRASPRRVIGVVGHCSISSLGMSGVAIKGGGGLRRLNMRLSSVPYKNIR